MHTLQRYLVVSVIFCLFSRAVYTKPFGRWQRSPYPDVRSCGLLSVFLQITKNTCIFQRVYPHSLGRTSSPRSRSYRPWTMFFYVIRAQNRHERGYCLVVNKRSGIPELASLMFRVYLAVGILGLVERP